MGELGNLGILYNTVGKNYNLGTYEEFQQKMSDPANRKAFHEHVGQKFNLGTYDEFEAKVLKPTPKKKDHEDSPSDTPQVTSPSRLDLIAPEHDKISPLDLSAQLVEYNHQADATNYNVYQPTLDDIAKQEAREIQREALKEQVATIRDGIEKVSEKLEIEKDNIYQQRSHLRGQISDLRKSSIPDRKDRISELQDKLGGLVDDEAQNLHTRINHYGPDALSLLNQAEKALRDPKTNWGEFYKGLTSGTLEDFITLGITEMDRNFNLMDIAKKSRAGEQLTEQENNTLVAYGLLNEVRSVSDPSILEMTGQSVAMLAPYMAEFAISGPLATSVESGVKYATKNMTDNILAKYTSVAVEKLTSTGARTAVSPRYFSGVGERQIGQVDLENTEQGLVAKPIPGTEEKPGVARAKSFGVTFTENFFEGAGDDVYNALAKTTSKSGVIKNLNPTVVDDLKSMTKFSNFPMEFAEEVSTSVAQSAIEGEPIKNAFRPDELIATGLSLAVPSGMFHGANWTLRDRSNYVEKLNQSEAALDPQVKKKVNNIVESNRSDDSKAEDLLHVMETEEVKEEEKADVIEYAIRKQGFEAAKKAESGEVDVSPKEADTPTNKPQQEENIEESTQNTEITQEAEKADIEEFINDNKFPIRFGLKGSTPNIASGLDKKRLIAKINKIVDSHKNVEDAKIALNENGIMIGNISDQNKVSAFLQTKYDAELAKLETTPTLAEVKDQLNTEIPDELPTNKPQQEENIEESTQNTEITQEAEKASEIDDNSFSNKVVMRSGEIKGDAAHFATDKTNAIVEGEDVVDNYKLSNDIKIADVNNKETLNELKEKAIEMGADKEFVDGWKPDGEERANVSYNKPIEEAARELGYDGMTQFDVTDGNKPTALNVWNLGKVDKIDRKDSEREFVMSTDNIETDESRFQMRNELDEDHVQEIVDNYDPAKMDPIIVWNDPNDNKSYVLSGHHRLEAHKRLGKDVPVREFKGTEDEAVKFATESNVGQKKYTDIENAAILRKMREDGKTKKEIEDFAKAGGNRNAQREIDYSHLSSNGKTMDALRSFDKSNEGENTDQIKRIAQYIGRARGNNKITEAHENEMFEYLSEGGIDKHKNMTEFVTFINDKTSRFDFEADKPLNLKQIKEMAYAERQYKEKLKGVESDIKQAKKEYKDKENELKRKQADQRARKKSRGLSNAEVELTEKRFNDIMAPYQAQIDKLLDEYNELRKNEGKYKEAANQEISLFDTFDELDKQNKLTENEKSELEDIVGDAKREDGEVKESSRESAGKVIQGGKGKSRVDGSTDKTKASKKSAETVRGNEKSGSKKTDLRDFEQELEGANSIAELQNIADKYQNKARENKAWQQKMEVARKNKWYEPEDVVEGKKQSTLDELDAKLINDESTKTQQLGLTPALGRYDKMTPEEIKKNILSRGRGLPKFIYNLWQNARGKVSAHVGQVNETIRDLNKSIKKTYGKDVPNEMLNEALSGNISMDQVHEDVRPHLQKMRSHIDSLSDELMDLGMIDEPLKSTIDKNRGYYMTRTYRKHTDKNWTYDNIPLKIKRDAAKVLVDYFPNKSASEIEGLMKALLSNGDIKNSLGGVLGKTDQSVLKKRSEFLTDNPEIRALLGEHKDPAINYATSIGKMAELVERAKFLENSTQIGIENGWLKETADGEYNQRIGIENPLKLSQIEGEVVESKPSGTKSTQPINEYFTTPEIKKAFEEFYGPSPAKSKLYRYYLSAATAVKLSKTAFSIKSISRNFLSNPINLLANANWNFGQIATELKDLTPILKDKERSRELMRELREQNILDDNITVGAVLENIKEITQTAEQLDRFQSAGPQKAGRQIVNFFLKLYGAGDDIYKTIRYFSEKNRYQKVYEKQGMSPKEAESKAKERSSEIVHKTTAFYSQQPKVLQALRKWPLTGTFVSFPYLTMRNFIGTVHIGVQELKDPATAHIGMQRLAGTAMAISSLSIAALLINRSSGVGDDDIENIRRFLPDYWKNDIIAVKKANFKDGKFTYKNLSFMDYYNSVTQPALILLRNFIHDGKIDDEDLITAMTSFVEPYASQDLLAKTISDLMSNHNSDNGRQIYNPSEDFIHKYEQIGEHLWGAVQPGTYTDIKKTIDKYRDGGDYQSYMKGMFFGSQNREVDILQAFARYNTSIAYEAVKNARQVYFDAKYKGGKKDITAERERAEELMNKALIEYRKDYEAAIALGISRKDINQAIKDKRFDSDIRNAIINNERIHIDNKGAIVEGRGRLVY